MSTPTLTAAPSPTPPPPEYLSEAAANTTTPPKRKRNPAWVAAGLGLLLFGGLGNWWFYTTTSEATDVVAVRTTVERGATIRAEDLMTVNISLDPALHTVPGDRLADIIGQRATQDLEAGGLVTDGSFAPKVGPGKGNAVVGISATPAQMPAGELRNGDKVVVVLLPDAVAGQPGDPESVAGVVTNLTHNSQLNTTVINVAVPEDKAVAVAAAAANGKAAVVLSTRER